MEQTRFNPNMPNAARHFNGKSVTAVTVNAGVDLTDEFGPNGAVQGLIRLLTQTATPILMSAVRATGTTFDMYFEGDFESMSEFGPAKDLTFAEYLEAEIQALGATAFARPADFETVLAGVETESAGLDLTGAAVAFDANDPKFGLVGEV